MPNVKSLAATVEDYDSDCEQAIETSPKQKSSGVPPSVSASRKPVIDAASDSGYSSRTAATVGSTESAEVPPKAILKPATSSKSPTNTKAKPLAAGGGSRKPSLTSDQKPPSRPPSRLSPSQRCFDPSCADCSMRRRSTPSPREPPSPPGYMYPARSPGKGPYPPYPPTSPHPQLQPRQTPYLPTNVPFIAPPQPRRRPTAGGARPRPQSYHPGTAPDGYWIPVATTPSPYEHGPPPAPSAYASPLVVPQNYGPYVHSQSVSPSNQFIPSGPYAQPNSLMVRPSLPQRTSDNYFPRGRPTSMYVGAMEAPLDPNTYTQALVRRNSTSRHSPNPPMPGYNYSYDLDRQRMPPPPVPPKDLGYLQTQSRRRTESAPRYTQQRYYKDNYSDSSGSDPDATVTTRYRQPRSNSSPERSSYQRNRSQAHEHIATSAGRRNSYADHQRRQNEGRRTSTETDTIPEKSRSSRRPSRPAPLTEEALSKSDAKSQGKDRSNSLRKTPSRSTASASQDGSTVGKVGKVTAEGFKIQIDRQGMNFNVNGQTISVMPREGGTADLIFAGQEAIQGENTPAERSESSGSRGRGRSLKSSAASEGKPATAGKREQSSKSKTAAVATTYE